jgi:ATP-dependent DNA helicase UvrD/PcrA
VRTVPEPPAVPGPGAAGPGAAGPGAAGPGAAGPGAAGPAEAVLGEDGPAEAVLAALDPEQQQVALAARGPVCVLAGAGTGKTRAIAHRIAYAVLTGAVDPGHVLAVTFTTRAAGELRARLHQLGGPGGALDRVQARTFHSAALRQLTHFWPQTVGGRAPAVLDSKVRLLAEAARQRRVSASAAELRDLASEIEWAKVTQVRPDEYARLCGQAGRVPPLGADVVARLYARYEELRAERHLVDFESVLELTAAILAEHRVAAATIRDRYRYFVVDEYQDVNPLQKLLLDSWLHDRDDVCVVGDPRQTIYSFAGASASYLTGFTAEFPAATVVRLVRNYRSSPQVIALANQLTGAAGPQPLAAQLRRVPGRPAAAAPPLVAQRAPGPAVEFTGYRDEQQEASAIAARVQVLRDAGADLRQIAVLVRTNAQTLPLEQAFADLGLPCQVRGAERFFDRAEVRQAAGLLRAAAIAGPPDGGSAGPPARAAGAGAGPAGAPGAGGPGERAAGAGDGAAGPGEILVAEVRQILAGLGLTREPPAGRGSARDRWESLAGLAQLAADHIAAHPNATLGEFAAEVARRGRLEHAPALRGVTLTSLHAAKGLEWDTVFLPGLTEGNLPIVYAQTDDAVEEERRLLYVGVTRAREQLFLSWPQAWSSGTRPARQPSRFLDGLRPRAARRGGLPVTGR